MLRLFQCKPFELFSAWKAGTVFQDGLLSREQEGGEKLSQVSLMIHISTLRMFAWSSCRMNVCSKSLHARGYFNIAFQYVL